MQSLSSRVFGTLQTQEGTKDAGKQMGQYTAKQLRE